jgi:hypothetical protein
MELKTIPSAVAGEKKRRALAVKRLGFAAFLSYDSLPSGRA